MKKVLLATSALVASAGFAAADIDISGFAEMGIVDNGSGDAQFHQDIDVTFKLSGTTDNGLSFGTAIDLDEVDGELNFDGPTQDGVAVFISGAFGTLTLGDTDTAADWATTETNLVGSLLDEMENAGRDGNSDKPHDGQVLRYDYSMGAFGFALSAEQDSDGAGSDDAIGIGAKYSADLGGASVGFGVGYMDLGADDAVSASVTVGFDAFTGVLFYSDDESDVKGKNTGIGVSYTTGALTIGANYGEWDDGTEGTGVAVNYDLGGGAVVQAGYADDDGTDIWSLGLAMSF